MKDFFKHISKFRSFSVLVFCGTLLLALFYVTDAPYAPQVQLSFVDSFSALGEWHPIVDKNNNAYFMWRSNPLEAALLGFVFGEGASAPSILLCANLFFLFLGTAIFFRFCSSNRQTLFSFASSLLFLVVLVCLYGRDAVLVSTLAWFPWFLYSLRCLFEEPKRRGVYFFAVTIFGLQLALSANQFAFLLVLLALFFAQERPPQKLTKNAFIGALIVSLGSALFVLFEAPVPEFPDYPEFSHVVPDDNIKGTIQPLVGPSPSLPVIDRDFLKLSFGAFGAVFGILLGATFFLSKQKGVSPSWRMFFLAGGGVMLALLETLPPDALSQAMPLYTLRRIIPGLFFLPLVPLILALSWFFFVAALQVQKRVVGLLSVSLVLVISPFHLGFWNWSPKLQFGSLSRVGAGDVTGELKALTQQGVEKDVLLSVKERLVSPSYSLISKNGLFVLLEREGFVRLVKTPLQNIQSVVSVSHNSNETEVVKLIDGDMETTWSTQLARQSGEEWVHIFFEEPIKLHGIELATGSVPWDFPRGLEIYAGSQVSPDVENARSFEESYEKLISIPSWQGAIKYSPNGYPYYSAQGDVRVFFPKETTLAGLLIRQIQNYKGYEWSIAEINLLNLLPVLEPPTISQ